VGSRLTLCFLGSSESWPDIIAKRSSLKIDAVEENVRLRREFVCRPGRNVSDLFSYGSVSPAVVYFPRG